MAQVKLTKSELRKQQQRLMQLQKYLPTLQLKKALLQTEVNEAKLEIMRFEMVLRQVHLGVSNVAGLLSQHIGLDFTQAAQVATIYKRHENIAGVNIPVFERVEFIPFHYSLFTTPASIDGAVALLRDLAIAKAQLLVVCEKKEALAHELREVTIRVNLFEKNLIPKAEKNIKKIKIFLGDQQLAAISQAKVAKIKIEISKQKVRAGSLSL